MGIKSSTFTKNNRLAVFVLRAAHSLNLVGVNAAQKSSTVATFFGRVKKL